MPPPAPHHTGAFGRRRVRRLLGLLAAVVGLGVVVMPSSASAHARLVASTPAQGDRLGALPAQVTFEFDQEMAAPAYVIVTAPDGTSVASGEPDVDGTTVRQRLGDGPPGSYAMAYRVVSRDGHQLTGQVSFTVGAAAGAPSAAGPPAASPRPADPVVATASPDRPWSRRTAALAVGGGLFAAALLLLLASRRAPP